MKKIIATITLLIFAITLVPTTVFAATPGTKVAVTIPTFKVVMNGQVVDNTYRQYPFLVYNDITYFPMTYWDMHFLGVSNTWSTETGSVIVTDGTSSEYKPTLTDVKNKTKNTASVNTGTFKVNGKVINNSKEEYPILSFRDVPYFPLTWNWCQEFGWNISFDIVDGLTVKTAKETLSKNTDVSGNKTKVVLNTPTISVSHSYVANVKTLKTSWTQVVGADGYELYIKEGDNGAWKQIKQFDSSVNDYESVYYAGAYYYFKVRAYAMESNGNKIYSDYSNVEGLMQPAQSQKNKNYEVKGTLTIKIK